MTDIRIIARADRRARTGAAVRKYATFGAIAMYTIAAIALTVWLNDNQGAAPATVAMLFAALLAVAGAILWLIWREHQ